MILGEGGTITRLAVDACEVRGLHYIRSERDDRQAIRAANPWAVIDTRELAGREATEALGLLCAELGITAVVLLSPAGPEMASAPGLLIVQTGPVFTLEEGGMVAGLLDAIESGQAVEVRRDVVCDAVYGPCLVDGVLDLLLDRTTGLVSLVPGECWSTAELAEVLAAVAGHRPDLLVGVGEAARVSSARTTSYLVPMETMLERFVRDRRAAKRLGRVELLDADQYDVVAAE
jgi:hypothetical protein